MKRFFCLVLLSFLAFGLKAQIQLTPPQTIGSKNKHVKVPGMLSIDSIFKLPIVPPAIGDTAYLWYDPTDSTLNYHTGSTVIKVGTGIGGVGSLINVGSAFKIAIDGTDSVKTIDFTNGLTGDTLVNNQVRAKFGGQLLDDTTEIDVNNKFMYFRNGEVHFDSMHIRNGDINEDWLIRNRNVGLGFPVAVFKPSSDNGNLNFAFDIMPNGTPGDYSDNGITWVDVCDANVSTGSGAVGAARIGISTTAVTFGSRAFGGASAKPVNFVVNNDTRMTLSTTNTSTFNIGKITQSQSLAGDYVGYSLFNTNNTTAESSPIFFIGNDMASNRFAFMRWNNGVTNNGNRKPNQLEIVANQGASGGVLFGNLSGKPITFVQTPVSGSGLRGGIDTLGHWTIGYSAAAYTDWNVNLPGTIGISIAGGTTAQRTISGLGGFRYNSDSSWFEGYDNTAGAWRVFGKGVSGGGGSGTVTSVATNTGSGITGGTITTTGTIAADTTNVLATRAQVQHRIDSLAATISGGSTVWSDLTNPTADLALTFDAGESTTFTSSNTTEDLFTVTTSTLTTGSLFSLNSTSTALAAGNNILELVSSGANGTSSITATGLRVSVTNTGTTSLNRGIDVTASGATRNVAINATGEVDISGETKIGGISDQGVFALQMAGAMFIQTSGTITSQRIDNTSQLYAEASFSMSGTNKFVFGVGGSSAAGVYQNAAYFQLMSTTTALKYLSSAGATIATMNTTGSLFLGGSTAPTARLHLSAGTTAASTAPLKFVSGSLMTTAEAGGVEFLTDKWYGTITTGAARKEFTMNDAALTSGTVPVATTNGRLTDGFVFVQSTYNPTPVNGTNVSSSGAFVTNYTRIGNTVRVFGALDITVTSASVASTVDIDLPIPSAFASTENLAGTASFSDGTVIQILANVANDRATFSFTPPSSLSGKVSFNFEYEILIP